MYRFKIYFLLILFTILVGCTGSNNIDTTKQDISTLDNTQSKPTQTITNEKNDITVYITPKGKRFHLKSTCAGKNAIKSLLSEIKSDYTPCKKCAK